MDSLHIYTDGSVSQGGKGKVGAAMYCPTMPEITQTWGFGHYSPKRNTPDHAELLAVYLAARVAEHLDCVALIYTDSLAVIQAVNYRNSLPQFRGAYRYAVHWLRETPHAVVTKVKAHRNHRQHDVADALSRVGSWEKMKWHIREEAVNALVADGAATRSQAQAWVERLRRNRTVFPRGISVWNTAEVSKTCRVVYQR